MPTSERSRTNAITFSVEETVPPEVYALLLAELADAGIPFEKEVREKGYFASVIWYMLPAIAILIAKPFFEAMAKKAGEDTYAHFKPAVVKLLTSVGRSKALVVGKSAGPLAEELSLLIAFYAKLDNGISVKFLVDTDASEEAYEKAVEAMCALLETHYLCVDGTDLLSLLTRETKLIGRTLLLRFDGNASTWKAVELIP